MDGFANTTSKRAEEMLRLLFYCEPTSGMHPVLELVGFLLGDEVEEIQTLPEAPLTTEEWLYWNQLAMDRPTELVECMNTVLEQERVSLPSELNAMRNWAAWLVQSTLEQLHLT